MAPKTKRQQQLAAARHVRHASSGIDESEKILIAKRLAFSIMVTGNNFNSVSELMLWNDIEIPPERTYLRAQKIVTEEIIKMAQDSCKKHRESMVPNTTLSMDGSWSHRRNSNECVLDFIDLMQKKIVDFEFTTKDNHSLDGDYDGASNGMEIECLIKMIPRWKNDEKVVSYTHDNDGKTRKAMQDHGWNIKELNDINHSMKAFNRKFTAFNQIQRVLYGLHDRLARFLKDLIYNDLITLEKKEQLWINVANHYCGDHSQCMPHGKSYKWPAAEKEGAKEALELFLSKTLKIIQKVRKNLTTQLNESFHALKAKYANKDYLWLSSWKGRVAAAILQFNEPDDWKFKLYEKLCLPPLSSHVKDKLLQKFKKAEVKRDLRRNDEYKLAEARRRALKRQKINSNTKGLELYCDTKMKEAKFFKKISEFNAKTEDLDFEVRVMSYEREELESCNQEITDHNLFSSQFSNAKTKKNIRREDLLPFFDVDLSMSRK